MYLKNILLILIVFFLACKNNKEIKEQKFDKTKWAVKKDNKFIYRDKMLADLMNNHKLHGLTQDSVLNLLGEPTRTDTGYLFYIVAQSFFPETTFPISTKSLVIKFNKEGKVEWRKIHN